MHPYSHSLLEATRQLIKDFDTKVSSYQNWDSRLHSEFHPFSQVNDLDWKRAEVWDNRIADPYDEQYLATWGSDISTLPIFRREELRW